MSGAFLTRGQYGGLVRGCRKCKAALSGDMSCPRCGPRVVGEPPPEAKAEYDGRRACAFCHYLNCAPTCPKRVARPRPAYVGGFDLELAMVCAEAIAKYEAAS